MLRRSHFALPHPSRPALRLPLFFSQARLRPRPLLFHPLHHAGMLPVYRTAGMPSSLPLPPARAPRRTTLPRNNNRALKVVKKPLKLSRNQRPSRFSSSTGRARKTPFQPYRAAMQGVAKVSRPRLVAPSSLDLIEEVRALHALWRAGPAVTVANVTGADPVADVVPKGRRKPDSSEFMTDRRAMLLAEARALHDLWRAGPAGSQRITRSMAKANAGPSMALRESKKMLSAAAGKGSKKPRARKNKKLASKPALRGQHKPSLTHSAPNVEKPVFSLNVKTEYFSADDEPNAILIGGSGLPVMVKREVNLDIPTSGMQPMVTSSLGSGNTEAGNPIPGNDPAFETSEELPDGVSERVTEFLGAAGGGMESDQMKVDIEKEREEASFQFFTTLLRENPTLRSLYVGRGSGSSVGCLICHSLGENKSFDKVLSLVMHTTSRVNRRPEHRGYGRALSAIVGWNSNRAS